MSLAEFFGELATQPLFIVYRLQPRTDGRTGTDKVPVDPLAQAPIDCHNAANRMTLDVAEVWACERGDGHGVGYVLTEGAGTWFLDLDHCRTGGAWAPYVAPTLARFPGAFVEASSSGDGLHVLGRYTGPRPLHRTRCVELRSELYTSGRFVALTGTHASGSVLTDHTAALAAFVTEYFPARDGESGAGHDWTTGPQPGSQPIADDNVLIERALRSTSAAAAFGDRASFADLWSGDTDKLARAFPPQTAGQSHDASAADLALANMLMFWTANDCERTARLMRASGLYRPKHDREDYVRSTVLRARQTSVYNEHRMPVDEQAPAATVPAPDSDFAFSPDDPMPNARLFVATEFTHAERPLLVNQGGAFHFWDGTAWPELDRYELDARLYKFFERRAYAGAKGPAPFQPNRNKIANLREALQAVTLLPARTAAPMWLTPNALPASEVISCENGLIHWPTRALHEHTPTFFVYHSVPFAFDPAAPKPERWLSFLRDLWPDDPESIESLQEWFGYLISGDTSLQKMLLLYGTKRSGKGTIARVLTALLGEHNVAGPTLASFAERFGLMALIGKAVAVISDARLGGDASKNSAVVERLLSISGEDTLTTDRKHLGHWSGKLPARIVVLTNELPKFNDASGALPSRFIVLHLHQSFYGRENPNLTDELVTELPGIFNWALDGLARLRTRGRFVQPAANADDVGAFEDLSSPVAAFVRDRCETGPGLAVKCSELYGAYRIWCGEHGHRPTSDGIFGRNLKAVKSSIQRERPRTPDGGRIWVYSSVALLPVLARS